MSSISRSASSSDCGSSRRTARRRRPRTVSATASAKDGFSIKSADGKFAVRLKGLVQTDGRFFLERQRGPGDQQFFLRRARPILEATVGKYLEFRLTAGLRPGDHGAVRRLHRCEGRRRPSPCGSGKFKPPVDLERLQSRERHRLRRARISHQSRAQPRRRPADVGRRLERALRLAGGGLQRRARSRQRRRRRQRRQGLRRPRVLPAVQERGRSRGLGFGVAGTTGLERGTHGRAGSSRVTAHPASRPSSATLEQPPRRPTTRSPTAAARVLRRRPTSTPARSGCIGEYIQSWQAVTPDAATTVPSSSTRRGRRPGRIFLTGEKTSFRSAAPKKPFDPKAGTFGAVELAARYSELSIDDATFPAFANPASAPSKAKAWAVGLNWYLAKRDQGRGRTTSTRRSPAAPRTGDRAPENFVVTRFQHSF